MATVKGRTPGVDSARRVLNVLLMFAGDRAWLTVEEIAAEVGISTPSAYRFLSLLRELELVDEHGAGTYALTPRVFALASSAEEAFEIGPQLRSVLRSVASSTGEAALIMRRVGDHVICAEMVQTEHTIQLSFAPGQSMSLNRGAGPKLLLASMGQHWAEVYLQRAGVGPAEQRSLLKELKLIENRGWSVSDAEVDEGIWASAAPVIVGGRTVAALSVAGPRFRVGPERQDEILDIVVSETRGVSSSLTRSRSVKSSARTDEEEQAS